MKTYLHSLLHSNLMFLFSSFILTIPSVSLLDVSYGSLDYKYCECGRKNTQISSSPARIVGGTDTLNNEYPWIALIVAADTAFPKLICGGSLISDQYVLTAAHCLQSKYTQSQMKVILCEHYFCSVDIRTVTFSIEKLIQHSKYISSKRLLADIMLVKLNKRVTFNVYIRPICLPTKAPRQSVRLKYGGKIGEVLGWGLGDTLNESCTLRKTRLFVYGPEKCPYKAFNLFCAGHPEGNSDTCAGDSGGPFQIRNSADKHELIGITSSGIACGDAEAPGLYTDVTTELTWIGAASRDSMYC